MQLVVSIMKLGQPSLKKSALPSLTHSLTESKKNNLPLKLLVSEDTHKFDIYDAEMMMMSLKLNAQLLPLCEGFVWELFLLHYIWEFISLEEFRVITINYQALKVASINVQTEALSIWLRFATNKVANALSGE